MSSEAVEGKLVNGYATLQPKEVYVAGVKIFYGSQTGTAKVEVTTFSTHLKMRFEYVVCLKNTELCKNLKVYWKAH